MQTNFGSSLSNNLSGHHRSIPSNDAESEHSSNDDSLTPVPISERRLNPNGNIHMSHGRADNDESNHGRIEVIKQDARPVSIMLRNCFPPCQAISDLSKDEDGQDSTIKIGGENIDINSVAELQLTDRVGVQVMKTKQHDDNDDNNMHEDEDDTTLNNYKIFTKTSQWRDKAKRNIFLPIDMSIVVSYSFLLQLHFYQKDEDVRAILRDLFDLDIDTNNSKGGPQNDQSYASKTNGATNNYQNCYTKKYQDDNDRVVVLCSKLQDTRSSHPLWDHINEKLDDLYDLIPKGQDIWNDLYKAMRIEFRAIVPSQSQVDERAINITHESDEDCVSRSSCDVEGSRHMDSIGCKELKSVLLATSPLHPHKLKAISPALQNSGDPISTSSTFKESIPHSLPPNSIVVHFSDDTTRVCPELFDLLVSKGIIIPKETDFLEKIDLDKFAKRFDDNVFDVLADHGYFKAKLQLDGSIKENTNEKKNQEFAEPIDRNRIYRLSNGAVTNSSISQSNDKSSQIPNRSLAHGAFTDALKSLTSSSGGISNPVMSQSANGDNYTSCDEDENDASNSHRQRLDLNNEEYSCVEATDYEYVSVLTKDIKQLEYQLIREERILNRLIESKKSCSEDLAAIGMSIKQLEKEISEIEQDLSKSSYSCHFAKCMLEVRRKTILRSLFRIYPIQLLPDSVYTIRGIQLPHDMHSLTTSVSDEVISAGLGFVCHVVSLCSKYLSIPLRYRVICNSSRSAVKDDDLEVFPLFKERVVEREQFDRAVVLLQSNVDLLLQSNGISGTSIMKCRPNHILEKLYLLFHDVIEN